MEISRASRRFFGILISILLVIAGCSGPTRPPQPPLHTLTPTRQPAIPFTQTPTLSPTPTETATPLPTETASPTPPPTSTPTFQPSLQPTQAFAAIQEFLSQGMDCPSPCFFGIIPDQSTFDQAANILNWLRQPIFHSNQYYSSEYDYHGLTLDVTLAIKNRMVNNIELDIGLANYEGHPSPRAWRGFSPNVLVKKYDTPSQVGFDLVASPSPPGSPPENAEYNMVLYFEHFDLTVIYELGLTKEGSVLKICPLTDQFQGVRVYFGKDLANLPGFRVPLEKASSLTLQQFAELITQQSKPACFDISKEAFGPPYYP